MKCQFTSLAAFVLLTSLHMNAYAIAISFDDKSAFLAATGATSATGLLPNLGMIAGGTGGSQTIGTLAFSSASPSLDLFIGTSGLPFSDWYAPLAGNDIAISGTENINVSVAVPVYSLGFAIAEPNTTMPHFSPSNFPTSDATFTITLLRDAITIGVFTFNPPENVVSFFGAWADVPFNRVGIREALGGIDDEYFGQFYTGSLPAASVPEPSTFILVGAGLVALACRFIGRRQPQKVAGQVVQFL